MPTQYTYEQLKSNWASWIVAFTFSLPMWLLAKAKFKVTNDLWLPSTKGSCLAFTPLEPN
jgi:hypothetical protein